jgi:hypothetical protein
MRRVGTTSVARIWEHSCAVGSLRSVATMTAAGVAHENRFLLDSVATLSMGGTWIDRVSVVEAPADRVPFDDLVAHVVRC